MTVLSPGAYFGEGCILGDVRRRENLRAQNTCEAGASLVHISAQPKPSWTHLPVSPCLLDWGEIMLPTHPTKCAYVEPKSGRV